MTYCVGLALEQGVVLLSDTRTNAGVDNIATFSKLTVLEEPGERVMAIMTAGNLAVTQAVVARVIEGAGAEGEEPPMTLATAPTMFDAARLVGEAVRDVFRHDGQALQAQNYGFEASFLLAGQIKGRRLRLFQIYSAGNFIESTQDTPFLQIGEHKYGKPILDRVARFETPLEDAVKLALISMDSTLRSNLSVGMPADLLIYRRDALEVTARRRINDDDAYFRVIREGWSAALRDAYRTMPKPPWPLG
ncbi:MAG: proteasome-type protease [Alphaproteobacteria bacterium]